MGLFKGQEEILALADNHCLDFAGCFDNRRPELGDKSVHLFFVLKNWIMIFLFYLQSINCKRKII
jgi:hypothetical protein